MATTGDSHDHRRVLLILKRPFIARYRECPHTVLVFLWPHPEQAECAIQLREFLLHSSLR